jgi:hypothetical protein
LVQARDVSITGASEFTVMLNDLLSLRGGTLSSVTVTWTLVEVPALAIGGRQL